MRGEISEGLVMVQGRAVTIRNLLAKGGKLIVAYPESGRSKRTKEQLQIYQEAQQRLTGILGYVEQWSF